VLGTTRSDSIKNRLAEVSEKVPFKDPSYIIDSLRPKSDSLHYREYIRATALSITQPPVPWGGGQYAAIWDILPARFPREPFPWLPLVKI